MESLATERDEKSWSDIRDYDVATNNACILGKLEELIINDQTGKIADIAIRTNNDRGKRIKGAKMKGDYLFVPFSRVEKVGEFIIVAE
jgi:sporulation protein YlmC with PRC-barrel domain